MFTFIHKGGPYSDCTSTYDIELDREYTISEFIQTVLTELPTEWGRITLYCESPELKYPHYAYVGYPYCEYEFGNVVCNSSLSNYSDVKVENVSAFGGWSNMNYSINIDYDEFKRKCNEAYKIFVESINQKRKAELLKRRTIDISPINALNELPVRKSR